MSFMSIAKPLVVKTQAKVEKRFETEEAALKDSR